jgi:type II secretory pathway component PulF
LRAEPFQEVLNTLVGLGAERVLVLEGPPPYKVRAAYGMKENQPWSDQVSLSLLEETIGLGSPLLLGDALDSPRGDRWSLMLNQVRSVLCVPFWTPSSRIAGILYADTRSRAGVFSRKAMDAVQACARQLEASLYGGRPVSEVPDYATLAPDGVLGLKAPSSAATAATKIRVAAPAQDPSPGRPRTMSVTIFYRSLATMVAAGLPLVRALDVLAQHQEDRAIQHVLRAVSGKLHAGSPLSVALGAHPKVFSSLYLQMVRVGEKSGCLHSVLPRIAQHREKSQRTELQLRHSLSYPSLVLGLCLLLLVLAPPFLLQGQLDMIRASGEVAPWPTRVILLLSDTLRSPVRLACVLAVGAGLLAALRRWTTYAHWFGLAWRFTALRSVLQHLLVARFAATLALAYRVGVPLDTAVRLAAASAQNPLLDRELAKVQESIVAGRSLVGSLREAKVFPAMFLNMVHAGAEAGKLDDLMSWVAQFYELELSESLTRLLSLIEPILLMGMGLIVGLTLLATLLPMAQMVEHL